MSQGDRTGPMGQGPGTGRNLGFCSGYDSPGYLKGFGNGMRHGSGYGRGMGRGYGWGRNYGSVHAGFSQHISRPYAIGKNDEIRMLKSQAEEMKRFQQEIENRLKELEKQAE